MFQIGDLGAMYEFGGWRVHVKVESPVRTLLRVVRQNLVEESEKEVQIWMIAFITEVKMNALL